MTAPRIAWGSCAAAVTMLVAGLALTVLADDVTTAVDILFTIALVTFPVVGALVASRRPGNAIGWLFCGAGALFAASSLAHGWATYAYGERPALPGGLVAAWLNSWLFLPAIFGIPQLLFLLFPTGRPLGPRWRMAVWLAVTAIALQAFGAAFASGPLADAPVDGVANPVGFSGGNAAEGIGWALTALSVVCATVALILRFHRARGEERLQLKWFLSAALLFTVSVLLAGAVFTAEGDLAVWGQLLIVGAFATIPVAAGVAILRHRLYDIDVVIRRTLIYGALTATLAAGYLGCVLLAQLVIGAQSDLAIAASTLAMAALFRPARERIQAVVDRRFYRRRYDAGRTLEAFGGRLRDELDLEALGEDLRGVVRETVQPAHVSLWLRGER